MSNIQAYIINMAYRDDNVYNSYFSVIAYGRKAYLDELKTYRVR